MVRTNGSQPLNRGSIPRGATKKWNDCTKIIFYLVLIHQTRVRLSASGGIPGSATKIKNPITLGFLILKCWNSNLHPAKQDSLKLVIYNQGNASYGLNPRCNFLRRAAMQDLTLSSAVRA